MRGCPYVGALRGQRGASIALPKGCPAGEERRVQRLRGGTRNRERSGTREALSANQCSGVNARDLFFGVRATKPKSAEDRVKEHQWNMKDGGNKKWMSESKWR